MGSKTKKSTFSLRMLPCLGMLICVSVISVPLYILRTRESTVVSHSVRHTLQLQQTNTNTKYICILGNAGSDTMAFRSHLQWRGSFVSFWAVWGDKPQSVQELGNSTATREQVTGYEEVISRKDATWKMPMYTFDCRTDCPWSVGLQRGLALSRELHIRCEYFFTTDDDSAFYIARQPNTDVSQPLSRANTTLFPTQVSDNTIPLDVELERIMQKWRPAVAAFPWAYGDQFIQQCSQVVKLFDAGGTSEVVPLTCFDNGNVIYHESIVDFFIPYSPDGEGGFVGRWTLPAAHLMLFVPHMFRHNAIRIQTLSYNNMINLNKPIKPQAKPPPAGGAHGKVVNGLFYADGTRHPYEFPTKQKYINWLMTGLKHKQKTLELSPQEVWWAPERGHPPYNDDILLRIASFFDVTHPAIREKLYIRHFYSDEHLRRTAAYPFRIKLFLFTQHRLASFKRLWASIEAAWYHPDIRVDVNINVDAHPQQSSLVAFIRSLAWSHGSLNVQIHEKQVGLKSSILNAWSPSMPNEYAIFLEDDIEVSPLYMHWALHGIMQYARHDASNLIVAREQWYILRGGKPPSTHIDVRRSALEALIANPPSRSVVADTVSFSKKLRNVLTARNTLKNGFLKRSLKVSTNANTPKERIITNSSNNRPSVASRALSKENLSKTSIRALITHHERAHSLVGVSLYTPKWNQVSETAFRANTSNMPFVLQAPCSWGAVYFPLAWQRFRLWMQQYGSIDPIFPYARSNFWPANKSWKKYLLAMMVEEGLGMVYPNLPGYHSLSTNHMEAGTNEQAVGGISTEIRSRFEVPLFSSSSVATYKFFLLAPLQLYQLSVYDVYHRQLTRSKDPLIEPSSKSSEAIYLPRGTLGILSALTIIMPIFDRRELLSDTLNYYSKCPCIEHIVVVDNNVDATAVPDVPDSIGSVKITYLKSTSNSLNNRFEAVRHADITTLGVLSLDDDVRIQYGDVCRAFAAWQLQPHRILGFRHTSRAIRPNNGTWKYDNAIYKSLNALKSDNAKIVALTGAAIISVEYLHIYSAGLSGTTIQTSPKNNVADINKYVEIRRLVDNVRNGEDLAMNMLIANITKQGPMIVDATIDQDLMAKLPGLWKRRNHFQTRNQCLNDIIAIYGTIALLPADIIVLQ